MSNDELRRVLRGMGTSPRVLNGHNVDRLCVDMWIVDGDRVSEGEAVKRITAERGPDTGGDVKDFLLTLANRGAS